MTKVEELKCEGLKTNSWSSSIEDSHVLSSCIVMDPDPDFEMKLAHTFQIPKRIEN